ncbi:hypothetical protein [Thalassotalea sp. PLHSN55]|uniref:hypothetical protein n=1 Tax=Thalassotalea sp. PLHSN55 TaxID=3435888 RepID=UPI003F853139
MNKNIKLALLCTLMSSTAFAASEQSNSAENTPEIKAEQELVDMSDPMAVMTKVGVGITDRGFNLNMSRTLNTGSDTIKGMNVFEMKGLYGEDVGFSDAQTRDNSIDSFRWRQLTVDSTNGRGSQLDVNFNVDGTHLAQETADISYSVMQALPKVGPVNLFPLAGVGASFGNNVTDGFDENGSPIVDQGFSGVGAYGLIGMYSKIAITDRVWVNYNPFYFQALGGSDLYKAHAYGVDADSMLLHEFAISYKISPRANIRYFANWSENVDFKDGQHRIEFNYQL